MHHETLASHSSDVTTADQRWAAWVARGVKSDRKNEKRFLGAAALLASGLVVWLALVVLLG